METGGIRRIHVVINQPGPTFTFTITQNNAPSALEFYVLNLEISKNFKGAVSRDFLPFLGQQTLHGLHINTQKNFFVFAKIFNSKVRNSRVCVFREYEGTEFDP